MKLTNKNVGLGISALAVALMGSAAIADNMDQTGKPMGGPMMMAPPELNFDAIDTNKDGKISQDEITAWRAAQTKGIDANGDGKLSVDEIANMRLKEMTDAAHAQAVKMVARLDTDGDGMLSAAELLAPPMPPNLFERVDTNKDGFIDKAEADAAMQKMMDHDKRDHHGKRPPMPPAPGDAPPPAPDGNSGN